MFDQVKDYFVAMRDAISYKKMDIKQKKLTLQLFEDFKSLDALRTFFDFNGYTVRPNGIIDDINVSKIHITIDKDKKDVIINGTLSDGSYVDHLILVSKEEAERRAANVAGSNISNLGEYKTYLETELKNTEKAIKRGSERIKKYDFERSLEEGADLVKDDSKKKKKSLPKKK